MMPETGDKVRVIFEGEYSHQGGKGKTAYSHGATGFHVVNVADQLGYHTASVPPQATIEVVEKALPPEPPVGAMVTLNAGLPYDVYHRNTLGWVLVGTTLPHLTWRKLHDLQRPVRRVYVDPLLGAPELPYVANVSDPFHAAREITIDSLYWGGISVGAARFNRQEAIKLAKAILAATGGLE